MKSKIFACLILLAATACAAMPSSTDVAAPGLTPAASVPAAPPQTVATAFPTVALTVSASQAPSAVPGSTGFPTPIPSVRAAPTALSATTTASVGPSLAPGGPNGWKTFASTKLQAVLQYPPDWSAREDGAGVNFMSPSGTGVVLARVDTAGASPEVFLDESMLPNTRCAPGSNAHGMTVFSCKDTISFAQSAYLFVKSGGSSTRLWSLRTSSRGSLDVFNAMIATVQPAP